MESRWTSEEVEAIREGAERAAADLPRRRPGTHWTGPSGEHIPVEVPATPRTVVNVGRLGRAVV